MSRLRKKKRNTGVGADDRAEVSRPRMSRRTFIGSAAGGVALVALGGAVWQRRSLGAERGALTAYRSPTCECCGKWIAHMRTSGFKVNIRDMPDATEAKRNLGVPAELYSCHTSEVDAYVFEGHVPADLVARVLRERPAIRGLAVPGMPQSAPGMDIGHERYEVLSFTREGNVAVYAVRM